MTTTTDTSLAEIVTEAPGAARILEKYGLDYCCGGRQPLADACAAAGVDTATVVAELDAAPPAPTEAWTQMAPGELVDHIESTHHAYLHSELPRLDALMDKVLAAHGGRHPELAAVAAALREIRADLEPHLAKEERVLFPMIRELSAATTAPEFHCGSLQNPISMMMMEHDRTGELIERLRELTGGYEPPADGCNSYKALFAGMHELETDTHLHIHKENNVLFPAVVALESRVVASSA